MLDLYKMKLQEVAADEGSSEDTVRKATEELAKIDNISVSRTSVEEFNHYFTERGLYAEMGAISYAANYQRMMALGSEGSPITLQTLCQMLLQDPDHCAASVDLLTAKKHLIQHADNTFSSVNAAGLPFPFFGGDQEVVLFGGKEPYSGSGLDLSGGKSISDAMPGKPLQGLLGYLKPLAEAGQKIDFTSPEYMLLATDPMWVWFEASTITADVNQCSNDAIPGTKSGNPLADGPTANATQAISPKWCTKYNQLPAGAVSIPCSSRLFL